MPHQFPLKVSQNGRYLVDQENTPFLIHADTAWRMIQRLHPEEIEFYLDNRIKKGFNAIHLHIANPELEGDLNIYGQAPFDPPTDLTSPNAPYWEHVDRVLETVTAKGLFMVISAAWLGYMGEDYRPLYTIDVCKTYGRFLAERYKGFTNILWVLGGDDDPGELFDAICAMGAAIKAGAPHHLITVHNHPENPSAAFFDRQSWLDVNMVYTYLEASAPVYNEYSRALEKIRPIYLGETGYEDEGNTGFRWSAFLVRRQVYWSLLSGAAGHAYGSRTIWHFGAGWQSQLEKPGTCQMQYVLRLFQSLPWWTLVPDREQKLVIYRRGDFGKASYVASARAEDGSFAIAYIPNGNSILIDLSQMAGKCVRAWWYNPRNGSWADVNGESIQTHFAEISHRGIQAFVPPDNEENADWLLVLDSRD